MKALCRLLLLLVCAAAPVSGDFAYDQRLGAQVPLDAVFRDDAGRPVRMAEVRNGRPMILALGYFHCPNLCGVVRADLYNALDHTGLVAGRDYTLIVLSIDPAETSADAATAKRGDVAQFPLATDARFLTGSAADIGEVAKAVGFRNRFDAEQKQFMHPAGIVFLTPAGVVSSYLLGVGYTPVDVRLAVTRADAGSIAAQASPVLLLCFHYDPTTGRYTLAVLKLLELGGALTVLVLGATLWLAFRHERRAS